MALKALLVRRTRNYSEQIYDLVSLIDKFGSEDLKIYDPLSAYDRPTSKIYGMQKRVGKFRQPKTMIFPRKLNTDFFALKYPIIAKPTHGFRGEGVKRCDNNDELEAYFDNFNPIGYNYGVIVQEEIQTNEEFRIIVIGGEVLDAVHKSNRREAANNRHQGAFFTKRDDMDRLDDMKKKAKECALEHNLSIAGVDLTIHNGEIYVIECNRNPEFKGFDRATNRDTAHAIIEYILNNSKITVTNEQYKTNEVTSDEAVQKLTDLNHKLVSLERTMEEKYNVSSEDIEDIKEALRIDVSTGYAPQGDSKFGPMTSKALGDLVSGITSGVIRSISSRSIENIINDIGRIF